MESQVGRGGLDPSGEGLGLQLRGTNSSIPWVGLAPVCDRIWPGGLTCASVLSGVSPMCRWYCCWATLGVEFYQNSGQKENVL